MFLNPTPIRLFGSVSSYHSDFPIQDGSYYSDFLILPNWQCRCTATARPARPRVGAGASRNANTTSGESRETAGKSSCSCSVKAPSRSAEWNRTRNSAPSCSSQTRSKMACIVFTGPVVVVARQVRWGEALERAGAVTVAMCACRW